VKPVKDRAKAAAKRGASASTAAKGGGHKWTFLPRFRANAFGWKSQPAMARIKEAIAEIKKIAKSDPLLAAEGAVVFLERVSPALAHVDGSSGAMGSAVNWAIGELAPIIGHAPADAKTRNGWLERLYEAHRADQTPWIESLADHWGQLCGSKEVASQWADRLMPETRIALNPDRSGRTFFHGTSACLSALYRAERFDELIDLLRVDSIWPYKRWAVKALVDAGKKAEAIRYAESCRSARHNERAIDLICEEILLSSGMAEEAYARYGLRANQGHMTNLATFRAIVKKYPHKAAKDILDDLVKTTPGEEGKWFAAAKEAGLYDEALALARRSPCDPKTLTRASRDYIDEQPAFAAEAGLLALHWLVEGYGYEITGLDVWDAYQSAMTAAERLENTDEAKKRIRLVLATPGKSGDFIRKALSLAFGTGEQREDRGEMRMPRKRGRQQ
jgi:hypothetical protein